jgi:hypothetical protein
MCKILTNILTNYFLPLFLHCFTGFGQPVLRAAAASSVYLRGHRPRQQEQEEECQVRVRVKLKVMSIDSPNYVFLIQQTK